MLEKGPDAGDLRERVKIQAETETPNDSGGGEPSWSDVATVWAQILPVRGDEQIEAQRTESVVLWYVTIRYRAGVTAANKLVWKGQGMNIRAVVDPDGRRTWLRLTAETGVQ